jgi:hypothetical protein
VRTCLLLATLIALPAHAEDWTWFASREGGYVVEVPAPPERSEEAGRVTWAVRLRGEPREYGVTHLAGADVDAALRAFAAAAPVPDEAAGVAGRRLEAGDVRARAFGVDGRVVVAWVRGEPGEPADRFLASFRPVAPAPIPVADGPFAAQLPGPAELANEIVPTDRGIRHVVRREGWVDGQRFLLTWSDLSGLPSKPEQALDEARRIALRDLGAKALSQRTARGLREVTWRAPDGSTGRTRLLYGDGRIYEVTAQLAAGAPPADDVRDTFFAGCRLTVAEAAAPPKKKARPPRRK